MVVPCLADADSCTGGAKPLLPDRKVPALEQLISETDLPPDVLQEVHAHQHAHRALAVTQFVRS